MPTVRSSVVRLHLTVRMRGAMFAAAVLMGTLWLACSTVRACPFCIASPTLTQRIDESEVACAVEWLHATPGNPDRGETGVTQVRVRHLFRDTTGSLETGQVLHVPHFSPGAAGELRLLFALRQDGTQLAWDALLDCSPELLDYLVQRPPAGSPVAERLPYFLDHLEHPDETIAVDAYSEFAAVPYSDVAALAPRLPREKLHHWISEPAPETGRIARVAFYGMLLGLCGNEDDAAMLEQVILTPSSDLRIGIEGVMAGYLRLRGEAGLEVLERHVLASGVDASEAFAFQKAIQFEWEFGADRISRQRLRAALHPLLADPQLAELIVVDLTRWEDLSLVDELVQLFDRPGYEDVRTQRSIASYYLTMAALDPAGRSPEEQAAIAKAHAHLESLRTRDAELVADASRRHELVSNARVTRTPRTLASSGPPPLLTVGVDGREAESATGGNRFNPRWVFYPTLLAFLLIGLRRGWGAV